MILVVVSGAGVYFSYHAFHGRYGIFARSELRTRVTELKKEHSDLLKERAMWQRRVGLLSADKIDPDFLEEAVRDNLNWSHANDVIILEKPAIKSRSE